MDKKEEIQKIIDDLRRQGLVVSSEAASEATNTILLCINKCIESLGRILESKYVSEETGTLGHSGVIPSRE